MSQYFFLKLDLQSGRLVGGGRPLRNRDKLGQNWAGFVGDLPPNVVADLGLLKRLAT
jgi:hypothetical protein